MDSVQFSCAAGDFQDESFLSVEDNGRRFNFSDGNVAFQVKGITFNLHRSILSAASPAFADMFRLGTPIATDSAEGTIINPIVLDTMCTLDELNLLARALYGGWADDANDLELYDIDSLLEVSRRWTFDGVYNRALRLLEQQPLSAGMRLFYGLHLDLDHDKWVKAAFYELARTLRPLSSAEVTRLGYEIAYKVLATQDWVRTHRIARLRNANQTGCCGKCQINSIPPAMARIASCFTLPLPPDVAPEEQLEWLQGQLRVCAPGVAECTRQACRDQWPSMHCLKNWLCWDGTEGAHIDEALNAVQELSV